MRKKILSGIFALAVLVTTGYGVNRSMESDADLTDLALMNVEALGRTENDFRAGYAADYKWINIGDMVTRIPCCKKVTDDHSGCNAEDDC